MPARVLSPPRGLLLDKPKRFVCHEVVVEAHDAVVGAECSEEAHVKRICPRRHAESFTDKVEQLIVKGLEVILSSASA